MKNYWLDKIKIVHCTVGGCDLEFIDLDTSLGNRYRCWIDKNNCIRLDVRILGLIERASAGQPYLTFEKERETVMRYAEDFFFKAGLLKEKTYA